MGMLKVAKGECMLGTRRSFLAGVGLVTFGSPVLALAAGNDLAPKIRRGLLPKYDFGGGLIIPVNDDRFGALWEGPDRWVAYGEAVDVDQAAATKAAMAAAVDTLVTLILTQAFAPDRLQPYQKSGWKLHGSAQPVWGEIDLPVRLVSPTVSDTVNGNDSVDIDPMKRERREVSVGCMVMKRDLDPTAIKTKARKVKV